MNAETSYLIAGLILGWITLAAGYVLFRLFHRQWHKRRYGVQIDYSTSLAECGRKLTTAHDLASLEQLLTNEFPRPLGVQRALLLLPETEQRTMLVGEDLSLPINHAAIRWVAASGEAQPADRGRLREIIDQSRLDLAWTQVWIPLMRGTTLQGLWLLGGRKGQLRYAPEDQRWLTAIAREAAAVLEAIHFTERERVATSEMRALYRQMVRTREMERGSVSRELHDGVLQDMCAVTRDLKALDSQVGSDGGLYVELTQRSGETIQALRAICNDLRPPLLQQDLGAALKAMVRDLDSRSPTPVTIDIAPEINDLKLSDEAALAIFRIVQEALHNATRHADASEIAVRLSKYPHGLRLTVTDDGRGIRGGVDPGRFVTQGHFGLAGMRERAAMIGGKLDVQTAVDYGTVVILELPVS